MLEFLSGRLYETQEYVLSFESTSVTGKKMHSNSMFIKDRSGSVVGLLCINFDSSRYQALSKQVMDLCGGALTPAEPSGTSLIVDENDPSESPREQGFPTSIAGATASIVSSVVANYPVDVDRLNQDEKMEIMEILDRKGVFFAEGVRELCGQGAAQLRGQHLPLPGQAQQPRRQVKRILPGE